MTSLKLLQNLRYGMEETKCSPKQYYDYDAENRGVTVDAQGNYYNGLQLDDGKWTRDQTQVLVDTWKKQKPILLNAASSSAEHFKAWKLIAEEVNKFQPPKSLQQCKKKFRNIRYICKTAMANNSENSSKKHFPLFYADFVEIINESERMKSGRKSYTPPVEIVTGDGVSDTSLEYPTNEDDANRTQSNHYDTNTSRQDDYNHTTQENGMSPTFSESNNTSPTERASLVPITHSDTTHSNHSYEQLYSSDGITNSRKHKMTDVSIMGRGYGTHKRYKKEKMDHYDSSSLKREQQLPTMAPFTQESYLHRNFASAALSSAARRVINHEPVASSKQVVNNTSALNSVVPPTTSSSHKKAYTNGTGSPTYHLPPPLPPLGSSDTSLNERFICMQERQIHVFSEMLQRHEQFLLRLLEQQREAAVEAQKRDREFMLSLVEMFVKRT